MTRSSNVRKLSCPECGQLTVAEYKPFCSSRCRKVDLHRWLSGGYAIPGEPVDPSDIERVMEQGGSNGDPNGSKH